jgi:Zn-finger protein
MSNKYKFFSHKECEYFPCHNNIDIEDFNCLFCYCPIYHFKDCGGNNKILDNKIKDCSQCVLPHKRENYDYINEKLKAFYSDK